MAKIKPWPGNRRCKATGTRRPEQRRPKSLKGRTQGSGANRQRVKKGIGPLSQIRLAAVTQDQAEKQVDLDARPQTQPTAQKQAPLAPKSSGKPQNPAYSQPFSYYSSNPKQMYTNAVTKFAFATKTGLSPSNPKKVNKDILITLPHFCSLKYCQYCHFFAVCDGHG